MSEAKVVRSARETDGSVTLLGAEHAGRRRATAGGRSLVAGLAILASALGAALPAAAQSYATVGPPPVAAPSGLPDGRVYEQVSPTNKNGNLVRESPEAHTLAFGLATGNGDAA